MLQKSQGVRLLDVFVLGPFMIWYALRYTRRENRERVEPRVQASLLFVGFFTIVYNAYNYLGHVMELYELP